MAQPAAQPIDASIAILGASGFLGAHLVPAAAAAYARVVAVSRRPEQRPWRAADPPSVRELALDLDGAGGEDALARLLRELAPRAIVLAAAAARVEECERDPGRAWRLNALLPERVAAHARELGARFVHVSSDLVFGGVPPRPSGYREEDATAPRHAYGRTKEEGERRALAAGGDVLVVRLPLLTGDSGGRGLGASDQVLASVRAGNTPKLFTDEVRTPLDVAVAARALIELAGRRETGRLHVAGPTRFDRHALGLFALQASGLSAEEARRRVAPARRADLGLGVRPADVALDASRARALLATELPAPFD